MKYIILLLLVLFFVSCSDFIDSIYYVTPKQQHEKHNIDKDLWNNGYHITCGKAWELVGNTIDNKCMYYCDHCKVTIFIKKIR